MKTKSIFIAAIALLALVLSACGPTTINQAAPVQIRTLNVTGTGQAILTPDIAYIYVGVHTENASATQAVSDNTAQTQKVIDALKNFGIAEKDIQTTNFSIYPNDKYDPQTGQPTGTKVYAVDNTVYVTVRKIDTLGDLLDKLVTAGANTINSIQFDVADKSTALKQARTDAVKDAQKQAQELAGAANVTLGDIQSINFYDNTPIPFAAGKGGAPVAEAAASVPVQTGQLTFTVNVSVTYAIK